MLFTSSIYSKFKSFQLVIFSSQDDGGDPIKYYTVERMDTEKGVWVPCGETVGKAPEFDVEGLNEGSTYMFRVKAVNEEGESEPLEATDTAKPTKMISKYGHLSQLLTQLKICTKLCVQYLICIKEPHQH